MHPFGTPELLDRRDLSDDGSPITPAIDLATSWEFPSREALLRAGGDAVPGRFYPRYGHPAGLITEARIARLEGAGGALLFSSGMAAIAGVWMHRLGNGDRLAMSRKCYGGGLALCEEDLPRFGVVVDKFDPFDPADITRALGHEPQHVHVETPVNPTGRVFDLRLLCAKAHAAGATVSCDATFLPPPFQRTLELGVDYAIHSCTKFLGGHTDLLAGVVSGSVARIAELERFRRRAGPIVAPETAWRLHRSLETLEMRVAKQCRTAAEIAAWLHESGRELGVERVWYPGLAEHPDYELAKRQMTEFGSVFSFEPSGGVERATRVYDAFRVVRRAVSLGGAETLASIPVDTSHHMISEEELAEVGFSKTTIRLSIGLEDVAVLRDDLAQALGR